MGGFDLKRWLPVIIVLAIGVAMVLYSRSAADVSEPAAVEKIEEPPPARDYEPPPAPRNIFEYTVPVVEESTAAVKTKTKTPKDELSGYYINGIVWSTTNPMVSVNGVLLTEV